jgi:CRP-like cAMP-binding protein
MEIVDALSRLRFFSEVPLNDIKASAHLWNELYLEGGSHLWEEGQGTYELGMLLSGQLSVQLEGAEVGRVDAGQLVGETSVFTARVPRTASVIGAQPCRVLLLSTEDLDHLRGQHPAVYDALLEQALKQIVRRINATDMEIARVAPGEVPTPARREETVINRILSAFGRANTGVAPAVTPILRTMEGIEEAGDAILTRLSTAFEPKHYKEGDPVFLEGEKGSELYLIGEGEVDVLRNVPGRSAIRLVTLGPGSMFGTGGLVLGGGRRTAACVATTPVWAFEMTQSAYVHLKGEPGRIWREALMGDLRSQIIQANNLLLRYRSR